MRSSARRSLILAASGALAIGWLAGGCSSDSRSSKKPVPLPPRHAVLPPRQNVPEFMRGTIFEISEIQNKDPFVVSGFGLVVGLDGTGDNNGTPMAVRTHILEEMVRHGFGSQDDRLKHLKPELVLKDPRTAIVEVYVLVPPGARQGDVTDAFVRAVEGSQTRSLARGRLYRTDLFVNGADPINPKGKIHVGAKAQGDVFVNPLDGPAPADNPFANRAFLRRGTVMNGGLVMADRPLYVRLRTPQLAVARAVEARIDLRFQDNSVAKTQDEGIVQIVVPAQYNGDWQHFLGVVNHLYVDPSPGMAAARAKLLVDEAQKPGALLENISYCWEAMGEDIASFIAPLYTHKSPDVAFAAARAGAYIRDAAGEMALMDIARTEGHAFQLNAVKVLADLPQSTRIDRMLTELLSSGNALVRIEAYRALADHQSPAVISTRVKDRFILDRVVSNGSPLVYATRTGVPRIALFGRTLTLNTPIMFSAMDNRFTISSDSAGNSIMLFDRTGERLGGIQVRMRPDLYELLLRLGGQSDDGFDFVYSDLVGILRSLSDRRHIAASFVLQDPPALQDAIEDAPPIVDQLQEKATEARNQVPER